MSSRTTEEILGDFIIFSLRYGFDDLVDENIISFPATEREKEIIRNLLKRYVSNIFSAAHKQIQNIYSLHIYAPNDISSSEIVMRDKIIYSDFHLLIKSHVAYIYNCRRTNHLGSEEIIMKMYRMINHPEYSLIFRKEYDCLELLNKYQLHVPKIYVPFLWNGNYCIPMEKIPIILNKYWKTSNGLNTNELVKMVQDLTPILKILHEHGYLYVDFSLNNIGIKNGEFYLFDFGSAIKKDKQNERQYLEHTPIFSSVNISKRILISEYDDFESIGFILIRCKYPAYTPESENSNIPLLNDETVKSKKKTILRAKNGEYGDFIRDYFNTISNNSSDIYEKVLNLCNEYKSTLNRTIAGKNKKMIDTNSSVVKKQGGEKKIIEKCKSIDKKPSVRKKHPTDKIIPLKDSITIKEMQKRLLNLGMKRTELNKYRLKDDLYHLYLDELNKYNKSQTRNIPAEDSSKILMKNYTIKQMKSELHKLGVPDSELKKYPRKLELFHFFQKMKMTLEGK